MKPVSSSLKSSNAKTSEVKHYPPLSEIYYLYDNTYRHWQWKEFRVYEYREAHPDLMKYEQ